MQCRSCMDIGSINFVNMVTTSNGSSFFEYFNACTHLCATLDDELPKTLCLSCCNNLRISYNFLEQARRSDAALRLIASASKEEALVPESEGSDAFQEDNFAPADPLGDMELADEKLILQNFADVAVQNIKRESERELDENQRNKNTLEFSAEVPLQMEDVIDSENHMQMEDEIDSGSLLQIEYDIDSESYHTTSNSAFSRLSCQICQSIYPSMKLLKLHLQEEHTPELVCLECPKSFLTTTDLQFHIKLIHSGDSTLQCPYCPSLPIIPREDIYNHLRVNHRKYLKYFRIQQRRTVGIPTQFQCKICKRYYSSSVSLADHLNQHTDEKPFSCKLCSRKFHNRRTKELHVKIKHPETIKTSDKIKEKQHKCEFCQREFSNRRCCRIHQKREHRVGIKECPHCSKQFTNAGNYKIHLKCVHSELLPGVRNGESAECPYCKEQISSEKIKTHIESHKRSERRRKTEKTFLCAFCPRTFRDSVSLKSHEKNIHSEKPDPIECHICNKKLNPEYLPTHIEKVHTNERKFACDECGNTFKSSTNLYYHKLLHKERAWQCTVCYKKYSRQTDLTIHMRTHTGERPYACHLCDERFPVKGRLSYHLQKHGGIKHRCKDCGKEYVSLKGLQRHMYKHTGMPYRCTICKYACVLRDVFTKHLQRVHNTVMSTQELREMFRTYTGRMPRIASVDESRMNEEGINEESE